MLPQNQRGPITVRGGPLPLPWPARMQKRAQCCFSVLYQLFIVFYLYRNIFMTLFTQSKAVSACVWGQPSVNRSQGGRTHSTTAGPWAFEALVPQIYRELLPLASVSPGMQWRLV